MRGEDCEDILSRLSARDQLVTLFAGIALVGAVSDARAGTGGYYTLIADDAIRIGEAMADQVMARVPAKSDEAGGEA